VEDQRCFWAPYECAGEENEYGCEVEPQGCKMSRHCIHKAEVWEYMREDI